MRAPLLNVRVVSGFYWMAALWGIATTLSALQRSVDRRVGLHLRFQLGLERLNVPALDLHSWESPK